MTHNQTSKALPFSIFICCGCQFPSTHRSQPSWLTHTNNNQQQQQQQQNAAGLTTTISPPPISQYPTIQSPCYTQVASCFLTTDRTLPSPIVTVSKFTSSTALSHTNSFTKVQLTSRTAITVLLLALICTWWSTENYVCSRWTMLRQNGTKLSVIRASTTITNRLCVMLPTTNTVIDPFCFCNLTYRLARSAL